MLLVTNDLRAHGHRLAPRTAKVADRVTGVQMNAFADQGLPAALGAARSEPVARVHSLAQQLAFQIQL